mmetsp:Transcript_34060/g.97992  ORF Transcript_34060/g.97992 Transcript_34060/m.97992 type:complete len:549 (-) Transcript_34060:177-1823(-)
MSTGCLGGHQHASLAFQHQAWRSVLLAPRVSERAAAAWRKLPRDSAGPAAQSSITWQTWLGPAGLLFAARAARARKSLSSRKAHLSATEAADHWFQSQVAGTKTRQPFDAELAERGVATVEGIASPLRQQEPWRYTDLDSLLYGDRTAVDPPSEEALHSAIDEVLEDKPDGGVRLVFVDGILSSDLSVLQPDDKNCFVGGREALLLQSPDVATRAKQLLQQLPEVDIFESNARDALGCAKLAALNQASFEDCACICAPAVASSEDGDVPSVVEVVFLSTGSSPSVCSPRILIDVGRNQRLHVVEHHLSVDPRDAQLTNGICRVLVAEGAEVKHDLVQQRSEAAGFVESLTAEVSDRATYELRVVQSGSRAARLNVGVQLRGSAAACDVSATMIAHGKQQLDLHSLIHHSVAACKSKQQHKNVVADAAECIFKGSIAVDKEAQQTQSDQLCRSLLLSKKAKVKAMPSLQIRADDVSCAHGAAVTELDEDQVFYLASRGLDSGEARGLLLQAFPQDLLEGLRASAPKAYSRVLGKLKSLANSQVRRLMVH